ncbi:YlzJ-like family protein [Bacillus fonticola]|uniref:YlzJ-like family protein n=1 Tax=Bacillus fonticola TaxID=2728853 RepID=UPI0014731B59|nr:YlzJ-like family protein [Bacillus fonticola]
MILYTTMPDDLVYADNLFDASTGRSSQEVRNFQGIPVLVEREATGQYRVVQVLSTDPNHYLTNTCTPGTKLTFPPS